MWLVTRRWSRLWGCCWDRSLIGKEKRKISNYYLPSNLCYLKTSNRNICNASCRYLIFARKWGLLQFCSAEGGHHLYLKVFSSICELGNGPLKTKMIWYEIQIPFVMMDGREANIILRCLAPKGEKKKTMYND